jgi:ComF family protein
MRDVIHAFKYEQRRSLADPLALQMRVVLADVLFDADYVVPVPLHPLRRLTRGFNQARDLAKRLGVPMLDALWRAHFTHQQMGLTAARRQRNLRNAFRLSPLLRTSLEQQVTVLVDDVRTTGATLDACARVLLDAGAKDVRAVTAAFAR